MHRVLCNCELQLSLSTYVYYILIAFMTIKYRLKYYYEIAPLLKPDSFWYKVKM